MNIQGIIKSIGETKEFGSNGFRKREFVIETQEQYPQTILLEIVQDKCDILDKYAEGQEVKVYINLRGRTWTNPQDEEKVFNTIQAWKIENLSGSQAVKPEPKAKPQQAENQEDDDGLPF